MNEVKIAGVLLVVGGVLELVYNNFDYVGETREASLEPIELSVKENQTINISVWTGVVSVVFGGILLLLGDMKNPA